MTNLNIDNAENMRNRAKMVAEIAELAAHFVPEVKKIEKKIATTEDHYGDYMAFISTMVDELPEDADRRQRSRFIALVLLKAGGNERGIMAAMTALGAD